MTVKAPSLMDIATFSSGDSKNSGNGNKTDSVSFNNIMNQSISANTGTSTDQTNVADSKKSTTGSLHKQSLQNKASASNTNKSVAAGQTSAQKNSVSTGNTKNVQSTKSTNTSQLNDASKKLNQLADDIKDQIEEDFDISEKDLENIMQLLGLNSLSLLQADNLRQVILEASGQDASALLTNEDLLNNLNSILDMMNKGLDQISEEFNVHDDALAEMINDLQMQNTTDQIKDHPLEKFDQVITDAKETTEKSVTTENAEEAAKKQQNASTDAEATDDTKNLADELRSKMTVEHHAENNAKGQSQNESHGNTFEQHGKVVDHTAQLSQNMVQSVQNTFATYMDGQTAIIDSVNVIKQVIDAVKITAGNQLQSIEIQLNPENLGKVNMTVSAKEGVITAQITAENEQVKKAIENQMTTLKQDFEQKGIKVDAIEVTVRGHEFEAGHNLQGENDENQKQNKNSRRHINVDELNEFLNGDETEDVIDLKDHTLQGTSSVNYTA